jgi:RimJ/RimL family protein N-acetyltransferase
MRGMTDWYQRPVLTDAGLVGPDARLRLEPLTVDHAPVFLAAAHDHGEQVFEHLSYPAPTTVEETTKIIERLTGAGDQIAYAQIIAATGDFAGTTSFYEINPAVRSLAIGHTWVAHPWWRSWLNSTSKLIMLQRAFEQLGAERVVWHTDIRNERSQQAIARLGAAEEGVLRHHKLRRDGSWRDTVQFSMLAEEWPAVKRKLLSRLKVDHERT